MQLTSNDAVKFVPLGLGLGVLVYYAVKGFRGSRAPCPNESCRCTINKTIDKDQAKVYSMVDVEDIGQKVKYCRCWRSSTFPICDGSHNKFNEDTGDNVAPVVIQRSK